MKLFKGVGSFACMLVLAWGCGGDSETAPSNRCAPNGCTQWTDLCASDADCEDGEFCEVRADAANTCESDLIEPSPCDGDLLVWEVSVIEDIPLSIGSIINELQLGSVDFRASVSDSTPPTELAFADVPLPFNNDEPLRLPFVAGQGFVAEIDLEHPDDRFRTFACGFDYEEMLASPGAFSCVLPVDGETVLPDDPTPTVQVKFGYDVPSECGVETNLPGALQINVLRAYELVDHPITGPGTLRQFGTIPAVLTYSATRLEPTSLEADVPFEPTQAPEVPLDWDGVIALGAVLDTANGEVSMGCTLDFSEALRTSEGFSGDDVSPNDPRVTFSEAFEGRGIVRCLDADDDNLALELGYTLDPLWQR